MTLITLDNLKTYDKELKKYISEGAGEAVVFDTPIDMLELLNSEESKNRYRIGQPILIIDKDNPDYWVSGENEAFEEISISVDQFNNAIETTGSVSIGWYKISILETSKINVEALTVDAELSESSENPVQNKVITKELDGKLSLENVSSYEQYDEAKTYTTGSVVFQDGLFYGSIKASNKGNPLTDTSWWQRVDVLVVPPIGYLYDNSYLPYVNIRKKTIDHVGMQNSNANGSSPPGGFIINRTNTNGVFTVGDPIGPYHATNKQYVDTALEDKLDKSTRTGYLRVYGIDASGDQQIYIIGTTKNMIAVGYLPIYVNDSEQWDNSTTQSGKLATNDPTRNYHAANKKYVDNGLWLPAYDETATYSAGQMVISGGVIYKSLIDSNTGNALTDTASWEDLLSGKLDKKTGSAGYWNVYAVNGTQQNVLSTVAGYSSIPTGYSKIPVYQPNTTWDNVDPSNGSVMITGDPKAPAHCANKKYVDEQIASVPKYYKHRITYHTNDGAPLYIDIIDYYSNNYTEDYLKSSDSPISNYNGLPAVKFNGRGALVPATIMRQNENIYFTYLGDDGAWVYNASATFISDAVTEL